MIVDHETVVRAGIAAMLADCHDIAAVAATDRASEALERCGDLGVEVVLMNLFMPDMDAATATTGLLARCPDIRVVVLTSRLDQGAIQAAVQAGASACLLKTVRMDELAEAIRGVMRGRSTFPTAILHGLVGQPGDQAATTQLTPRERSILTLLADGLTNKAIAETLGLSEGTIRVNVSSILAKLGAANRTEATVLAIQQGLVGTKP